MFLSYLSQLTIIFIILKHTQGHTSSSREKVIVIGGGPVGLATALILADEPHSYDVVVFEASTPTEYDPTKAYQYNINPRGQRFMKRYEYLQQRLEGQGTASKGVGMQTISIPGNPKVPIKPPRRNVAIDKTQTQEHNLSYFIPRNTMTRILCESVQDFNKKRDNKEGYIQLSSGKECVSLKPGNDNKIIIVSIKDASNHQETYHEAKLVVGADGMHSKVRECLAAEPNVFTNWKNMNPKKFIPKRWTSPSTNLRIKVLQFPPRFQIPNHGGSFFTTDNSHFYLINSIRDAPTEFLILGSLPIRDENAIRPFSTITRPNHKIWKINNGNDMRQWFQKTFPRLPLSDDSVISTQEWDRFAQAEGTRFPPCQYSPAIQISSENGEAGIVLVGDALHAFPPDIGQGINSGLEDAIALDKALRTETKHEIKSLGSRLQDYENERLPEIKALVRLARFGFPYQYKQPLRKDRLMAKLMICNILLRIILNKVSFGIIPPACIIMSQNPDLTYRQIMRRADATTFGLTVFMLIGVFFIANKFTNTQ